MINNADYRENGRKPQHTCTCACAASLSSHSSYCCSNSPAGADTYMHAMGSVKRAAAFTSHVTPPGWKDAYPVMQNPLTQ